MKPRAVKELSRIPKKDAGKIAARLQMLEHDLAGDVKKLTNFTPEYRMRSGDWRVLFEADGNVITVYRILHRRESYR